MFKHYLLQIKLRTYVFNTFDDETNISVTSSSSNTNMAPDNEIETTKYATTNVPASGSSFLTSLSENGCGVYLLKETELNF